MKEVVKNAKQAIKLYLEGLEELGRELPEDESLSVKKIAVSMSRGPLRSGGIRC
jgi:predicted RNase H-like HicB family nuclease